MKKKTLNYEEAIQRLEQITADMESGKMNIDELAERLKEAQNLIAFCKEKLTATDEEIQQMLKAVEK